MAQFGKFVRILRVSHYNLKLTSRTSNLRVRAWHSTSFFKLGVTHPYKTCAKELASLSTPRRHLLQNSRNWDCKANLSSSSVRSSTVPFKLADIGEGIKEVTIKEWYVKEGDHVAQFDQLCEVQSDKASVTITSRYDGIIRKIHHEVDSIAQVGEALVDIDVGGQKSAVKAPENASVPPVTAQTTSSDLHSSGGSVFSVRTLATPAVRRIAAEFKVNLADVEGFGKDGRVLKEDILRFVNGKTGGSPSGQSAPPVISAKSVPTGGRVEPMKGYTKAMVKSMTLANEIPHFGYFDEVDVTELVKLRKKIKESVSQRDVKISFMPFFIKAASLALSEFPVLNSTVDITAGTITYKSAHNIGVAMDTQLGLIVPNIKNVQDLSILDIAKQLNRLHDCGLSGSMKSEDLTGGTFTLSNIGVIGGTYAVPVIMPPEVAIGALGKIQVLPRFDADGKVVAAKIFKISWSADHRIIDGATMARFSNLWKSHLEHPSSMLLHMR